MNQSPSCIAFTLIVSASLLSHKIAAQSLPSFWDRDVDWVVQPASAHGATTGKPSPDSVGNLVWHYAHATTGGGLGTAMPWYETPLTTSVWDSAWYGGEGVWAVSDDLGSIARSRSFTHSGQWPSLRPVTWWTNTTSESFALQIRGALRIAWSGDFGIAQSVDTDVVIVHRDGATGTATTLFSGTFAKPHNNSTVESRVISSGVSPITIDPDDEILFSHHAWDTVANGKWVTLSDQFLCLVRDPIGTRYCGPAVVNSLGVPGEIAASGSTQIAQRDLSIKAIQLPLNSLGMFLVSRATGQVMQPGGSQGNLCLAGSIGRFVGANQVFGTGLSGTGHLDVNLAEIPTPQQGLIAVQPGETWNFQCWYRDADPGSTSNFTDAISVSFQ